MRFNVKNTIPADITRDLTIDAIYPRLAQAQAETRAARKQLADRQRQLAEHRVTLDRISADVRAGRATTTQLEDAMRRQKATALMIPRDEDVLQSAIDNETREAKAGQARLLEEARTRYRSLQAVASQVVPVLEALLENENKLDSHLQGILGRGLPGIDVRVSWPRCQEDEQALAMALGQNRQTVGTGR